MTLTSSGLLDWSLPFDDLAVGQAFITRGRTVTESDIVSFAALSGDWHPLHTDAEWAANGPFGQRIAHGLLVVSIASGLVPFDPACVVALRRVGDATFKRPVFCGDTIHVQGQIQELAAVDADVGRVTLAWKIVNQEDVAVCRLRVDLLWRRYNPDGV